jgi:hypothetical protein
LDLEPVRLGQPMPVIDLLSHPTSSAFWPPIIAEVLRRSHESAPHFVDSFRLQETPQQFTVGPRREEST